MNLLDQIKDPRRPKGSPNDGLHYCSLCGKRGRTSAAVEQHQKDAHGGTGEALREPARKDMVKALLAAEELAEIVQAHIDATGGTDAERAALAAYREAIA